MEPKIQKVRWFAIESKTAQILNWQDTEPWKKLAEIPAAVTKRINGKNNHKMAGGNKKHTSGQNMGTQNMRQIIQEELAVGLKTTSFIHQIQTAMKPIVDELIKEIKEDQKKIQENKDHIKTLERKIQRQEGTIQNICQRIGTKEREIEEVKTKIQTQDRTDRILTLLIPGIVGKEDEVKLRLLALAMEKLKVPLTSDDFHMQALSRASTEQSNQVKGSPTFLLV